MACFGRGVNFWVSDLWGDASRMGFGLFEGALVITNRLQICGVSQPFGVLHGCNVFGVLSAIVGLGVVFLALFFAIVTKDFIAIGVSRLILMKVKLSTSSYGGRYAKAGL